MKKLRRMKRHDFINMVRTLLTDFSSICCIYTMAGVKIALCSFSVFAISELVMLFTSQLFVDDAEEVTQFVEKEV